MRRCNVCGNMGDDNSTVCEKCGAPYTDIAENGGEAAVQEEKGRGAQEPVKEEASPNARNTQSPSGERPPRRMRSGPQIYGQTDAAGSQGAYAQQGMVRRNVQGRPQGPSQGTPQGRNVRPVNQGQGSAQGRQAPQRQNRPAGPAQNAGRPPYQQGAAAGRPAGSAQGRPAAQGGMAGRPMALKQANQARQIRETARKLLGSPVFALIALLNTVYLVSSIAAIFMNQLNYSQIARLLKSVSLPSQVSGYVNTLLTLLASLDSGHIAINIVLNIPTLLFALGLWLIFITARGAKENMSGVGFGFAKACVIINLIKACAVMLICLVLAVAIVIASWVAGAQNMIVVSVVALVVVVVVVMMIIMYYFSYIATLKTCRVNADEGESYGTVSAYVAALHIILALFSIINLLSGIVNAEITGIVGSVGKMGWMILFGVWLLSYRGKMSEIED